VQRSQRCLQADSFVHAVSRDFEPDLRIGIIEQLAQRFGACGERLDRRVDFLPLLKLPIIMSGIARCRHFLRPGSQSSPKATKFRVIMWHLNPSTIKSGCIMFVFCSESKRYASTGHRFLAILRVSVPAKRTRNRLFSERRKTSTGAVRPIFSAPSKRMRSSAPATRAPSTASRTRWSRSDAHY
jgi:hypothetical protein